MGQGFGRESLEFCPVVVTYYNQYSSSIRHFSHWWVYICPVNSEPFNKRGPILGESAIPFYTAPTYIFFEWLRMNGQFFLISTVLLVAGILPCVQILCSASSVSVGHKSWHDRKTLRKLYLAKIQNPKPLNPALLQLPSTRNSRR